MTGDKSNSISAEFLNQSIMRMQECSQKIGDCLKKLDDTAFWYRPNEASNSVGHLLAHLRGNIRQYIVSGLEGEPDVRQRDREFEYPAQRDRMKVEDAFFQTVEQATSLIGKVSEESLLRRRQVQGFDLSGLGIILHVVEHLSYHTGQIAYITKVQTDADLGFYRGIDLNAKNE